METKINKNNEIEIMLFQNSESYLEYNAIDLETPFSIYSFDYEIKRHDEECDWENGYFNFEIEEALKNYNFNSQEELLNYCKSLVDEKKDGKVNWKKILKDFEQHGINVVSDISKGMDEDDLTEMDDKQLMKRLKAMTPEDSIFIAKNKNRNIPTPQNAPVSDTQQQWDYYNTINNTEAPQKKQPTQHKLPKLKQEQKKRAKRRKQKQSRKSNR